jgi:hypothetical protein
MTDQSTSHRRTRLLIIGTTFVIIFWGINQAQSVLVLNDVSPAPERNAGIRQRDVNPINNGRTDQHSESRDVNPSDGSGKKKQPQNVVPPNKNRKARLSQPKTDQDEKEAGIMKNKASPMFTQAILTIYFNKLLMLRR